MGNELTALGKGKTALERAKAAMGNVNKSAGERKAFDAAHEASKKLKIALVIDATASRQASWDAAREAQDGLVRDLGTIAQSVEIGVYAHSASHARSLGWHTNAPSARQAMHDLRCATGTTKIEDCFNIMDRETTNARPDIVVVIGDCFEENNASVQARAKAIGAPVFCFYEETRDTRSNDIASFKALAQTTQGACVPLGNDPSELVKYIITAAAFKKGGASLEMLKGTPAYNNLLGSNPNLLRLANPTPKLPGL